MFCTVLWTEDKLFGIIGCSAIVTPRKEFKDYKVKDDIVARFQGKPYPAKIVDIAKDKKALAERFNDVVDDWVNQTNKDRENLENKDDEKAVTESMNDEVNDRVKDADKDQQNPVKKGKKTCKRKLNQDTPKEIQGEEVENEITVIKEAKALKAKLQRESSLAILNEGPAIAEKVAKLERTVGNMSEKLDMLFSCRSCMRKIYKSIDNFPASISKKAILEDQNSSANEIQSQATIPAPLPSPNPTATPTTVPAPLVPQTVDPAPGPLSISPPKLEEPGTSDGNELVFLGDSIYGVKLPAKHLKRAVKTAKTADKLGLNLIEFLLSKEEIQNCTMYGNRQHGKSAVDENKKNALKSQIFSVFPEQIDRWDKIVTSLNDKIRKMKKGLYKL